jgi:hypothetical protein
LCAPALRPASKAHPNATSAGRQARQSVPSMWLLVLVCWGGGRKLHVHMFAKTTQWHCPPGESARRKLRETSDTACSYEYAIHHLCKLPPPTSLYSCRLSFSIWKASGRSGVPWGGAGRIPLHAPQHNTSMPSSVRESLWKASGRSAGPSGRPVEGQAHLGAALAAHPYMHRSAPHAVISQHKRPCNQANLNLKMQLFVTHCIQHLY